MDSSRVDLVDVVHLNKKGNHPSLAEVFVGKTVESISMKFVEDGKLVLARVLESHQLIDVRHQVVEKAFGTRKYLLLQEVSDINMVGNPSENADGRKFELISLGQFALNVDKLARQGDVVALEGPFGIIPDSKTKLSRVVACELQSTKNSKPMKITFFHEDPKINEKQSGDQSPVSSSIATNEAEEDENIAEPTISSPPKVSRLQEKSIEGQKQYTELKDCIITKNNLKYNVWAIITKVAKKPVATNGTKLMAQIFIQDPTYHGSYGFADFQFSLMGTALDQFPPLEVDSVIRIHHMVVQEYKGYVTGRVYDARAVVTVAGGVDDPIRPNFTSDPTKFQFTDEDKKKVSQLRLWWAAQNAPSSSQHNLQFHQVQSQMTFDMNCKVLQKIEAENDLKIARVSDGTVCPLSTAKYFGKHQMLYTDDDDSHVDIFFEGHSEMFDQLKEDKIFQLRGLRCVKQLLVDRETGISAYIFKFIIEEAYSADCVLLEEDNASAVELLNNDVQNSQPAESQPDSELNEMLLRLEESPPGVESNTQFQDSELFNDLVLGGLGSQGQQKSPNPESSASVILPSSSGKKDNDKTKGSMSKKKKKSAQKRLFSESFRMTTRSQDTGSSSMSQGSSEQLPKVKEFRANRSALSLTSQAVSQCQKEKQLAYVTCPEPTSQESEYDIC